MSEIAIFGGGFDPISLHHERMAEETGMATWTMPCWGHKFSKNSRLIPAHHRWAMTILTANFRNDGVIVPFDWEIKHQHSGSMYETISALKQEFPQHRFHIVIGMDNANLILEKWDRGNILIQENPFIVFGRGEQKADWFLNSPHKFIQKDGEGSSTAFREAIQAKNNEVARTMVNEAVWDYVCRHNLYGFESCQNTN